jgi:hypothetical protein
VIGGDTFAFEQRDVVIETAHRIVLLGCASAELGPLSFIFRDANAAKKAAAVGVLAMRMPHLRAPAIHRSGTRKVLSRTLAVPEAAAQIAAALGQALPSGRPEESDRLGYVGRNAVAGRKAVSVVVLAFRIVVGGGDLVIAVRGSRIRRDALTRVVAEADIARRRRIAFVRRGHQEPEALVHVFRDPIPVQKEKAKDAPGFDVAFRDALEDPLN